MTDIKEHKKTQCSKPNQMVHLDLFRLLNTMPSAKKLIQCMTDAFFKICQTVCNSAKSDKNAPPVGSALFARWLCGHGLPLDNFSDNGKEFFMEIVDTLRK